MNSEVVTHSDCKFFDDKTYTDDVPPTRSVVVWEYDGAGVLDIHHYNAGLNCIPFSFGEINVEDKTITVVQDGLGEGYCQCLFDIDYRLTGLPPGKYLLTFDEGLLSGEDEPLEGEIVLKGLGSSGELAAERRLYPWGILDEPTGDVVDFSSCGGFEKDALGEPREDYNCLIWEYTGNTLTLFHQNAEFNCCIYEAIAELTITADTIFHPRRRRYERTAAQ